MGNKLTRNDALKDRLSRYREINITVTGRKSGRAISIPVWFAFEDGKLYLLPVQGSDTQWYKNVLKNPRIRIDARGAQRLNFRPFRSLMPNRSRLWSRNSAPSMGPAT
jgi:deazaflavin-dependent oxidoreductase (nitroreductase family)